MAEPNEFSNGDKYYGNCCADPAPRNKLAVPLQPGEFAKKSPFKDVGVTREATTEFFISNNKPVAFNVEDAGCQAQKDPAPSFQKALESLLSRYCKDNASNTPDFLLAEYMLNVLDAFTTLNNKRERWYGRKVF